MQKLSMTVQTGRELLGMGDLSAYYPNDPVSPNPSDNEADMQAPTQPQPSVVIDDAIPFDVFPVTTKKPEPSLSDNDLDALSFFD